MSQYGGRGRGQFRNAAKPGLLGAAPGAMQRGLLDSLGPRKAPQQRYQRDSQYEPHYEAEKPKPGLLGPGPYTRQQQEQEYERQSYQDSSDYSYDRREDLAPAGPGGDHDRDRRSPVARLAPEVQQLMQNLGLSKADMEELSRLPESELSAGNLARAIRDLRSRKANAQPHDRRAVIMRQEQRGQRSSPKDMYDPSEPTDEEQGRYEDDSYHEHPREHEGRDDAFQTFEQKWYSGDAKEEQSRNGQGSSILRGSRGPAAKSNQRWREDQPPPMQQQNFRPDQPLPMHHQRLQATPPRHSPPRPAQRPPPRQAPRSGLLGDPHDPTTKELDLLAATINKRNTDPNPYHIPPPRERRFREPERLPEPPMRKPPPPVQPNPASSMLEAQMKAMQVLQTEALQKQVATKGIPPLMGPGPPGGRNARPKKFDDNRYQFTKQEAEAEGNKMRMAQGRVLYLRYKAGSMTRIVEADIIDLAAPFEKVTNILLVSPKNIKEGWYQAFLELEQYDGAAAMLEHFMVRPPSVKGIAIQFQRSNYQTLKLRQDQMNRDIGALVERSKMKRNRPRSISPIRGRQPLLKKSPDRSKRTRQNSKPRSKDFKDNREDQRKKPEQKTTSGNGRTPTKRNRASPSPVKAKVAKETPKKEDGKDKDEKSEPKSRKESKDDGHYMLVDEVGDEADTKTDGKKEEKEKQTMKKEPENDKPEETKEEGKKQANAVEEKPAAQNGTTEDEKTSEEDENTAKIKIKEEAKENANSENVETNTNAEKQREILESLEQVTNMSEALLKIVQMNSTKAIIGDILNYVKTSVEKLKEMNL